MVKPDALTEGGEEVLKRRRDKVSNEKVALETHHVTYQRLMFHVENTPFGYIEWNNELQVVSMSARAENIFCWSGREIAENELTFYTLVDRDDRDVATGMIKELLTGVTGKNTGEFRCVNKYGKIIWCEWFNSVIRDTEGNVMILMSLVQDVSERKMAEKKAHKANRLFALISEVTENILMAKDEKSLFHNSCRIPQEFGKFTMAWIGLFDKLNKKIVLSEQSGIPAEYLSHFSEIYYHANGPLEFVLRTGIHYNCNDIEKEKELEEWKELARSMGVRSYMILPIRRLGIIIGAYSFMAAETGFFNEEAIALLRQVSLNISFALDVFEREKKHKDTEELIVQNDNRFRALIEKSTDMKTLLNKEGEVIYGSPSITKVLGYSMEEYFCKSVYDFIHPDDMPAFIKNATEMMKKPGASFYTRQRMLHKNGNWVWCEGSSTNMLQEPGVHALVSNFRDISEKKIIEEQREFDKHNVDALINNTSDLMWSVDRNYNLITSNQPFRDIIRSMSGDVMVKGSYVLLAAFQPEQLDRYKKHYERALAGETFTEIEYSDIQFELWSEISYCPIFRGNEVIGTACHSRNITRLKMAERQLRASEAFIKGVLDSLSSHIAVIDARGNIVAVNLAWKRFAMENGDANLLSTAEGSNYFQVCSNSEIMGDNTAAKIVQAINEVMEEKKPVFDFEYPCDSPGHQRWFAMRVMKFHSDISMAVVTHTDITERKIAELQRNHVTNNLIQRNLVLEQFSYIISHNLRTPVANIIGAVSELDDPAASAEERSMLTTLLNQSVSKLDNVVKDLNTILQVKKEISEVRESIFFSACIQDIKISLSHVMGSDVDIRSDFSEIDEFFTTKSFMYSIFYNLISNSIKYRRPDVPCIITICSHRKNNKTELVFTDNGLGIDLQKKGEQVFGLYKRFHPNTKGKGMGLYMVKTQVEALGGTISIQSEVNKGTVFNINFEQ